MKVKEETSYATFVTNSLPPGVGSNVRHLPTADHLNDHRFQPGAIMTANNGIHFEVLEYESAKQNLHALHSGQSAQSKSRLHVLSKAFQHRNTRQSIPTLRSLVKCDTAIPLSYL